MNPKSLAIIVINWNGFDFTSQCIESLRHVTYPNLAVIVVDNGSNEEEVKKLRDIRDITLIENKKNLGFTGGNNVGIKYALENGFEYIGLLNNDTTVEKGFIEPLLYELKNSDIGAVQPKIMHMHDKTLLWSAGGLFRDIWAIPITIGSREIDRGQYNDVRTIDWVTGCCFIARRGIYKKIGLLDDKFFTVFEDTDWSLRVRKAGYILRYVPTSTIYHHGGASVTYKEKNKEGYMSPKRHYMNIRNHIFLVKKHSRGIHAVSSWAFQVIKVGAYSAYFITRGRLEKLKFVWRGFLEGLKT